MRFDKYDPVSGGFRAALAADYTGAAAAIGVGLDNTGKVTIGAANTGIIGVICLPSDKKAGDIVDVMTSGEIVEAGLAAGRMYSANTTTGVISTGAASATQTPIGFTVEAARLIVRRTITPFIGT